MNARPTRVRSLFAKLAATWPARRPPLRAAARARWLGCLLAAGWALSLGPAAHAGTNLLANGSFDDKADPLRGWRTAYPDNANYAGNQALITVIPHDGTRRDVLRIHGTSDLLHGLGAGVMTDSQPVPYEQDATYRVSLLARTRADLPGKTGPNARIYVEGWKWLPGIKPHPEPDWTELRKVYRQQAGRMMYFSARREGPFSNPPTTWQKGECVFPGSPLSAEARQHLAMLNFITLHIIAVDGWEGDLLIDDVGIERIK